MHAAPECGFIDAAEGAAERVANVKRQGYPRAELNSRSGHVSNQVETRQ
jgi:hypothetical protein